MNDLEEQTKEDENHSGNDNEWQEVTMQAVQHGIAILFDTMRYDDGHYENRSATNAMQLRVVQRRVALNAGMLEVVKSATRMFPKSTEIVLMGQQMLVTMGGYQSGNNNKAVVPSQTSRRKKLLSKCRGA
eukprot:CAMPEP_0198270076 /NCGR_PEP_ID=MMETSP1447-20131203/43694_1 /TAXON_ID=420782 /ORGANISM="Chaetoceros dichaeta, Strain CCMP1751" /LENGTH=129 /DNA_ID=CAMNT_0043961939 /DNA_START=92 /DNA_END=481 /DNA_ORIENTATION=+